MNTTLTRSVQDGETLNTTLLLAILHVDWSSAAPLFSLRQTVNTSKKTQSEKHQSIVESRLRRVSASLKR